MEDIVIVSAARTGVGKFGGSLAKVPATELGSIAIKAALERAKVGLDQVGEVIMGQVLAAGVGQNPARQALMKAGIAKDTPALTINAVCGSGLKAVMLAAQAVATGDSLSPGNCNPPPSGVLFSVSITWNSGLWLRLRVGCSASTTCSNGTSWCM